MHNCLVAKASLFGGNFRICTLNIFTEPFLKALDSRSCILWIGYVRKGSEGSTILYFDISSQAHLLDKFSPNIYHKEGFCGWPISFNPRDALISESLPIRPSSGQALPAAYPGYLSFLELRFHHHCPAGTTPLTLVEISHSTYHQHPRSLGNFHKIIFQRWQYTHHH